jgi:quinol monooxygenase YgiN
MAIRAVHLVVEATIYEGSFDLFEDIAKEMLAGSRNETGTVGYDWYLSGDRRRCRLMETYTDANALLAHFKGPVVQQLVPRLLEHSRLDRFEVYGDPGQEGAELLKGFGAEIFQAWHVSSR